MNVYERTHKKEESPSVSFCINTFLSIVCMKLFMKEYSRTKRIHLFRSMLPFKSSPVVLSSKTFEA